MKRVFFIISLSMWLLWLSVFSSYQDTNNEVVCFNNNSTNISDFIIATGGFPLKSFDFPGCYRGSDWPPSESWKPFFINFIFWFVISFLTSFILFRNFKEIKSSHIAIFFISSIVILFLGLNFLILAYD